MKLSEINMRNHQSFNVIEKEFREHYGTHYDSLYEDFKRVNANFIRMAGDIEIAPQAIKQAEQAMVNYFCYFMFGVENTLNPASEFNTKFDQMKAEAVMSKIVDRIEKEGADEN